MLTTLKFANRPVYLFDINGRRYYVTRSNASPSLGSLSFVSGRTISVFAPACMSYQQAAMKAAQMIAQQHTAR